MTKTEHEIKIRNDEVAWEPRPTLGSADYASLDVWEQERERIWFGEWICVGRSEEVETPGDYVVRDVAGTTPARYAPSTTSAATGARSSSTTSRAHITSARRSSARTTRGRST